MKKFILIILFLISPFVFPQSDDYSNVVLDRTTQSRAFKGFSLGLLIQGQIKYPHPYYGPKVNDLYNDGAYHFVVDFYIKKFIIGFQMTDEYLYLQTIDDVGAVWKPRGFNGSYSSLTRAYWISLGYNVFDNFNLKISIGFRNGPSESVLMKNKPPSDISNGYNYNDTSNIFNQSTNSINKYSEVDFSVSVNYPVIIYRKIGIVPELGYSFKHGGLISGISLIILN